MEEDETTEWWFAIAETVGGRTVAELQAAMGYREFVEWTVYLGRKAYRQKQTWEGSV